MPTRLTHGGCGTQGVQTERWPDRRHFLKTFALGGSAAGLAVLLPGARAHAAGQTEAVLLSCMDYRLVEATGHYMASRGLKGKYDHLILAGAALGALTDKFPAWNQTFWDHLGVAIDLHKIHKVIVLDHRDCGAYKVILGEDLAKDPAKETAMHTTQLQRLGKMVKAKHPALAVELFLMALDGTVEEI